MMDDQGSQKINFLIELGRLESARAELNERLQLQPGDPLLLLASIKLLKAEGQHEEALIGAESILAQDPQNYEAIEMRSDLNRYLERYGEAEKDLIFLIKSFPSIGEFYGKYAQLMIDTGHSDKALKLASEAIHLNPESQYCQWMFCYINIICGDLDKAGDLLKTLIRDNPDLLENLSLVVAKLLDENKIKDATRITEQLVQQAPNNPEIIAMAKELKFANHWSLKPFAILQRYGWTGSLGLWLGVILLSGVIRSLPEDQQDAYYPIIVIYGIYCLGSWIWPPILRIIFKLR